MQSRLRDEVALVDNRVGKLVDVLLYRFKRGEVYGVQYA